MKLTSVPLLKFLIKSRYPQLVISSLLLAGTVFSIFTAFFGSPVGNSNFAVIFVWIVWWAMLILAIVPFLGRGWCAVCPIPLPGEWLQRGAVLGPPDQKPRWLGLRVPSIFRNIWLQNISFLFLALFSSALLTSPQMTGIVLTAMLVAALALSLVFERRAFCRYLCPVGGFIGLYSQAAPLELRAKDQKVCAQCKDKSCFRGSRLGYGCPWNVFPAGLSKNTYCGLCFECLRTCPNDNIAITLRPFGKDLWQPVRRLDEAFKVFIMLGSALVYTSVFLGPWGWLKDAVYNLGSSSFFIYSLAFLSLVFGILPALFVFGMLASKTDIPLKERFAWFSTTLIPLGLMFWVAFSLSFVLTNASYILSVASDPLALGWNLFGTAQTSWRPLLPSLLAPFQTLMLVIGFLWSASLARKIALPRGLTPIPIILYSFVVTLFMGWLLL
jgi:hypothetical protein